MTSAPAIGFEYGPSRWLAWLLMLVTALAELAILLSGVPFVLKAILALGACLACYLAVRGLRVPVRAVGWALHSGWTLRDTDGADEPATLLSFRCLQGMILLRLAGQRRGQLVLWLMPDNSDADIRRRLRMRLAMLSAAPEADN
ncbi:hypothetical protein [Dyella acidiphila]|uniref:Toxin CptA n=1 Tax=Dyella acidiphila TaxID=2775866 RepID=A0ABR9GB85_9GAMM|nr:hypothetical protein [Dyella acidiphila]MBE1161286.1 hypothetical protein [Dyella acidiphila]